MSRVKLEQFVWELDQCFNLKPEHSLMSNLSSITVDFLDRSLPGGGRTLRDIIIHCGSVKRMHVNHAFGDRKLSWEVAWNGEGKSSNASFESLMSWLRQAHVEARSAVQDLTDDSEILVERYTYWGELMETHFIIHALLIHDVYHSGEINHLRSLL